MNNQLDKWTLNSSIPSTRYAQIAESQSQNQGVTGYYSALGDYNAANIPPVRMFMGLSMAIDSSYSVMYGGMTSISVGQRCMDLWVLDTSSNFWAAVWGNPNCETTVGSQIPIFSGSTMKLGSNARPGATEGSSVSVDRYGVVWVFGGSISSGYLGMH